MHPVDQAITKDYLFSRRKFLANLPLLLFHVCAFSTIAIPRLPERTLGRVHDARPPELQSALVDLFFQRGDFGVEVIAEGLQGAVGDGLVSGGQA